MGTAKALVEVDGVPLGARVARALATGGAAPVVLVGSGAGEHPPLVIDGQDLAVIADDRPGAGPLAALATALRWAARSADAEVAVVAACDQPDLTAELVVALVAALDHAPDAAMAAVPVSPDGRHHPFPSAWRVAAAAAVERLVAAGARRMHDALDLGVVAVPTAPEVLADLDTPAELAARRDRGRRPAP